MIEYDPAQRISAKRGNQDWAKHDETCFCIGIHDHSLDTWRVWLTILSEIYLLALLHPFFDELRQPMQQQQQQNGTNPPRADLRRY
jgi:hypothetical protein